MATRTESSCKHTSGNTASVNNINESSKLNHAILYPMAIGISALGGISAANAALIVNNSGFTVEDDQTVNWDINGDAVSDISIFDDTLCTSTVIYRPHSSAAMSPFLTDGAGEFLPITDTTVIDGSGVYNNFDCALHDRECNSGTTINSFNLYLSQGGGSNSTTHESDFGGYIGFQFDNAGTVNYGLASFNFSSVDGLAPIGTFSINGWVFDDSGAAVNGSAARLISSQVSEPAALAIFSSVAALAMGATGIRRRRVKLQQAQS